MALAVNHLVSNDDTTNGNGPYTTASITPTADALVLAFIVNASTEADKSFTVAGNSLTYEEEDFVVSGNNRFSVFRALGAAPSAGVVTITPTSTSSGFLWSIIEVTGVNTSGTNGSGAVVQSVSNTGSGTTGDVTLAAFSDVLNACIAGFCHEANEATTPDGDFSEAGDTAMGTPNRGLATEYRIANDVGPTATWATSSAWMGLALEVRDANSSPASFIPKIMVL